MMNDFKKGCLVYALIILCLGAPILGIIDGDMVDGDYGPLPLIGLVIDIFIIFGAIFFLIDRHEKKQQAIEDSKRKEILQRQLDVEKQAKAAERKQKEEQDRLARIEAENKRQEEKILVSQIRSITNKYNRFIKSDKPIKIKSTRQKFDSINQAVDSCVRDFINQYNSSIKAEASIAKTIIETLDKSIDNNTDYLDYLKSEQNHLNELKEQIKQIRSKRESLKIVLKEEESESINNLIAAIEKLNKSKKKYKVKGSFIKILKDTPDFIDYFVFDCKPLTIEIDGLEFCFFQNVIIVFSKNGEYITALNPSILTLNVKRYKQKIEVRNGRFDDSRAMIIASDSKTINRGETTEYWLYHTTSGERDMRYKYNSLIKTRTDEREYGKVVFKIGDIVSDCNYSSSQALDAIENAFAEYIKSSQGKIDTSIGVITLLKQLQASSTAVQDLDKAFFNTYDFNKSYCYIATN